METAPIQVRFPCILRSKGRHTADNTEEILFGAGCLEEVRGADVADAGLRRGDIQQPVLTQLQPWRSNRPVA